jgi:hypothetical protein
VSEPNQQAAVDLSVMDLALFTELGEAGEAYIADSIKLHRTSIQKTGFGVYQGTHWCWDVDRNCLDRARQKQELQAIEQAIGKKLQHKVVSTDCITYAVEVLKAAYVDCGKAKEWPPLLKALRAGGGNGAPLLIALKKAGWESVFYCPDAVHPASKAVHDRVAANNRNQKLVKRFANAGRPVPNDDTDAEHISAAIQASPTAKSRQYYKIPVDDQIINYRPTTPGRTPVLDGIQKLKQKRFFIGMQDGGHHCFVGTKGKVTEFHWAAPPSDPDSIQQTDLEKWGANPYVTIFHNKTKDTYTWVMPEGSGILLFPPGDWIGK